MQQPTTTAPSSSSSPASFANLLAALATPSQKPEEGWNDADLAPDVATLSYESALRSHARYKGPDRGEEAAQPQQAPTDQALTQAPAQSSAQAAVGAAMRARRRALATAPVAQQAAEAPPAIAPTGKSGRAKLRSARAHAAHNHRTEVDRPARGSRHPQAAAQELDEFAEAGELEMQPMQVADFDIAEGVAAAMPGAGYSSLPTTPVVEALNQPLIDREARRRELHAEEFAEQERWVRQQMDDSSSEPSAILPPADDTDARRARSAAFERSLKNASVTIRMSRAECEQLHQRAFEAGMTVSAYLRSCTFEAESLRAQVKEALAQMRGSRAGQPAAEQGDETEMRSSRRFGLLDVLTFGWLRRMMPQRQSQSVVNA